MDTDYDFQIVQLSLQSSSTPNDGNLVCPDKISFSTLPSGEQQQRATSLYPTIGTENTVTEEAEQLRSIKFDSMEYPPELSDDAVNNEVNFDGSKKKWNKITMGGNKVCTAAAGTRSKRKLNTDTWTRNSEKRMKGGTDNDGLNGELMGQSIETFEGTTGEDDSNFQTGNNKTGYDNDNEFLSHFDQKYNSESTPKAFLPDHLYCKSRTRLGVLTQCQEVQNSYENSHNYDNNNKLTPREIDQSLAAHMSQALKENRHGLRLAESPNPNSIGSPARHFDGNKEADSSVDFDHHDGALDEPCDNSDDDEVNSDSNNTAEEHGEESDVESDSTSSQTPIGDNDNEAADSFIRKICEGRSRFYECLLCGRTVTRCWNALEHIRTVHRKGRQAPKSPQMSEAMSDNEDPDEEPPKQEQHTKEEIVSKSPNGKLPMPPRTNSRIEVNQKENKEKMDQKHNEEQLDQMNHAEKLSPKIPKTPQKKKKQNKNRQEKTSFLSPSELEALVVRNPIKNFDLKRTLSVNIKLQRVTKDDIAWFNQARHLYLSPDGENGDKLTNISHYSRAADSSGQGRRVSHRLLQKKVDEIAEPLKYLTIYDDDDNEGTNQKAPPDLIRPYLFPRPPLVFDEEDEDTLSALSLLSEPGSSCHLIPTAPEIPFDYIFISGPPGSLLKDQLRRQQQQQQQQQQEEEKEEDQSTVPNNSQETIGNGELTTWVDPVGHNGFDLGQEQKFLDEGKKTSEVYLEEVPMMSKRYEYEMLTLHDLNYHVTAAVNVSEPETRICDDPSEPTIYSGLAQVAELISRNLLNDDGGGGGGDENGTLLIG